MCGICGFTGKDNPAILKKMADSIIHRGPDEEGFYSSNKVNMGVRRLSIVDIKTGHQPIYNEDKTIWLVFNGEIYNFIELRLELEKKGHNFYTDHSDSEVLVHLYEEYGDDFVNRLNGMFAIALWDNRAEKLLLIRDRMGVKPLFYSQVKEEVVFGSEIKAVLAYPGYKKQPDYEALGHYFTFKHIPASLTSFKGINSLLPGEMLICKKGHIEKKRYWKIRFDEDYDLEEKDITKTLFSLLKDSVKLRMRSDAPFGAYLSGGIDSSIVVALMARFSDKPVKTFSLGYEDEFENKEADLYYARKISELYNTEHYEYIMSYKELIQDAGDIIGSFDQPFSGTISTYFLSKLIKKHVKVALSGDGSDELFGSYLSHRTAAMHKEYGNYQLKRRYSLYLFSDNEKNSLFTDDFKKELKGDSSFIYLKKLFDKVTAKDSLNRILEMEWNSQFPDQVLSFVDILSMAHSVEIRSPFLDYRLVEFAATIPGNLKINNGNVKDVLKKSVQDMLPKEIIERPKEGFVLPVFDWMKVKFKDFCIDTLSEKRLKKYNLLNTNRVKDILNSYYSGSNNNAAKVWNLMMFQIWMEKYFL